MAATDESKRVPISKESPQPTCLMDAVGIKYLLDDQVMHFYTEYLALPQDNSLSNWKIGLGLVSVVVTVMAHFYPSFPEDIDVLIGCVVAYVVLQLVTMLLQWRISEHTVFQSTAITDATTLTPAPHSSVQYKESVTVQSYMISRPLEGHFFAVTCSPEKVSGETTLHRQTQEPSRWWWQFPGLGKRVPLASSSSSSTEDSKNAVTVKQERVDGLRTATQLISHDTQLQGEVRRSMKLSDNETLVVVPCCSLFDEHGHFFARDFSVVMAHLWATFQREQRPKED